jgi:hypothetical protein
MTPSTDVSRCLNFGLPKRWPLSLDRIKQIWEANAKGHLLEFFCDIAKDYELRNVVSQYFMFGPRCYNIPIPKNVEAILSTNFSGACYLSILKSCLKSCILILLKKVKG